MAAGDSLKNAWGTTQKGVQDGLKKASNAITAGENLAKKQAEAAEKKAQQEIAQAQQKFAQAEQKAKQELQQVQQKLAEAEKKAQQLEAEAEKEAQQALKELQQAQQQLADAEKKAQQEIAAAQKLLAEEEAQAKQKLAQAQQLAQQLQSKLQQTLQKMEQETQALQQSSEKAIQGAEQLAKQETQAVQGLSDLMVDASKGGLSDPATSSAVVFAKLSEIFSFQPTSSTTVPCANKSVYSTNITGQKTKQTESAPPKTSSPFTTLGTSKEDADKFLDTPEGQQFYNDVKAGYPQAPGESAEQHASNVYRKALGMIMSGTKPPVPVPNFNQPLFKIAPKESSISDFTPYFLTQADLKKAFDSGRSLGDLLGLPLANHAEEYVLYQINPNPANPPTVYKSTIAPTSEKPGETTTQGGATQTLAANRGAWSKPVPVLTLPNVKLPKK
jgi:ABC-type transporter Mla subunit MlaD